MTLSWPSFSAAATSAFMPPPAAAEVAVDQLVALVLLLLVVLLLALLLLELEELQPMVSSRPTATAAPAARACLARKISLPNHSPRRPGTKMPDLAKTNVRLPARGGQASVSGQLESSAWPLAGQPARWLGCALGDVPPLRPAEAERSRSSACPEFDAQHAQVGGTEAVIGQP